MTRADIRNIIGEVEGITDKHVSDILNLSHKETDTIRDERDELQKQLEEAKKDDKAQEWEKKYNKEHEDFEAYKKEQAIKDSRATKMSHLDTLLTEAKFSDEGKRIVKAIMEGKIDSYEADKDGKIKDSADLIKSLTEEWSGYVTKDGKSGSKTDPGNPGGGNGGNTFEEMNLTEKMAYANEHPSDPVVTAWLNK